MTLGQVTPSRDPTLGRRKYKHKSSKRRDHNEIKETRQQLNEKCLQTSEVKEEKDKLVNLMDSENSSQEEFMFGDPEEGIKYIIRALLLPAAYLLSLLLLYPPVEYLVSQRFGTGTWAATLGLLSIPLIIMTMQFGVSLRLSSGKRQSQRFWQFAGRVLILVTPSMLFATFVARHHSLGRLPYLQDILLILALMGLAFVTDVIIIHGGDDATRAPTYLWVKFMKFWRERRLKRLNQEYRLLATEAEQIFHLYCELFSSYNKTYSDSPFTHIPFNVGTYRVLSDWLDCDVNRAVLDSDSPKGSSILAKSSKVRGSDASSGRMSDQDSASDSLRAS